MLDNVPGGEEDMHVDVMAERVETTKPLPENPKPADAMAVNPTETESSPYPNTLALVPVLENPATDPLSVLARTTELLASLPRGSRDQVCQRRPRTAREQDTQTQSIEAIPLQVLEPEPSQAPQQSPGLNEQEIEKTLAQVVAAGKRKLDGEEPKQKRRRNSKAPAGQASASESSSVVMAPAPNLHDRFSDILYLESSEATLLVMINRKVVAEFIPYLPRFVKCHFTRYLEQLGLSRTASNFRHYDRDLVNEFYANIQPGNLVPGSPWYNRVFIRGRIMSFTTEIIREHLGLDIATNHQKVYPVGVGRDLNLIAQVITGRNLETWQARFRASALSLKYFLLYKVAIQNWEPSTNSSYVTTDMGILVYCLALKPSTLGSSQYSSVFLISEGEGHSSSLFDHCTSSATRNSSSKFD